MKITSSFPGKSAFPVSSSAKIQPADQISTAGPYCLDPRRSSGGLHQLKGVRLKSIKLHGATKKTLSDLYQRVITVFVKGKSSSSSSYALERPKSAIFKMPSLLSKRLDAGDQRKTQK